MDSSFKCYNPDCSNQIKYSEVNSAFCSMECKALYYKTTPEQLQEPPAMSKTRNLKEWIRFYRSGEALALYQERAKGVIIETRKSLKEQNLADTIEDFLSTPLGAEYARATTSSSNS